MRKKFRGSLVKKGRGETILMYWGKSDTPKMLGDPSCWDPSMFPPYHFRSYLLVNLWSCESRRRETVVGPPYRGTVIGCPRALSQKRQPRRCKVRSFAIYFHHSCTTTRRLCSYLVEQFSLSLCFRSTSRYLPYLYLNVRSICYYRSWEPRPPCFERTNVLIAALNLGGATRAFRDRLVR